MTADDIKREASERVQKENEKLAKQLRYRCFTKRRPDACHQLGDYLECVKKDFQKAARIFRSTCDDYRYAASCYRFGNSSFLGRDQIGGKGRPRTACEYYEKGCKLDDSNACFYAGVLLLSRTLAHEVKRNVPRALECLTKSCQLNNATACFYVSGMYISGVRKQIEDGETGADYIVVGTNQSKKKTSANEFDDFLVPKDMKKAFKFAYKACELHNAFGCANLSKMYGRGEGVQKSAAEAKRYKDRAVELQGEAQRNKIQQQSYIPLG